MAMSTVLPLPPAWLPMSLVPGRKLTDAEFEELCFSNDLIQFERTRHGEILMNAPSGMGTTDGNCEIIFQLRAWWKTHRRGRVVDSNGGFYLPDGSMLSPDAAYLTPETLKGITKADLNHFLRRTPDFIIELLSVSDRRREAEAKMQAWIDNGVKLAWLIDPCSQNATVYVPGLNPSTITGGEVHGTGTVEGFRFDLQEIWNCYEI
jgi:Uma2 family endonuclease